MAQHPSRFLKAWLPRLNNGPTAASFNIAEEVSDRSVKTWPLEREVVMEFLRRSKVGLLKFVRSKVLFKENSRDRFTDLSYFMTAQYNPNSPVASHFTQMVWKATTEVGCAMQECSGIFPASFGVRFTAASNCAPNSSSFCHIACPVLCLRILTSR